MLQGRVGWSRTFSFLAPIGPGVSPSKSNIAVGAAAHQNAIQQQQGLGQASDIGAAVQDGSTPFVFLAFNDVCMTDPLLFNDPHRGEMGAIFVGLRGLLASLCWGCMVVGIGVTVHVVRIASW